MITETIDLSTVKGRASALHDAFEFHPGPRGRAHLTLKKGSPQWMHDAIRKAHGELLPDDYRMDFICEAVEAISEGDDEADAWNHDALEYGAAIVLRLDWGGGQYLEKKETFFLLFAELERQVIDGDES